MPKIRRKSIENDFLLIFFCMQSEGVAQSSILMILRHPLCCYSTFGKIPFASNTSTKVSIPSLIWCISFLMDRSEVFMSSLSVSIWIFNSDICRFMSSSLFVIGSNSVLIASIVSLSIFISSLIKCCFKSLKSLLVHSGAFVALFHVYVSMYIPGHNTLVMIYLNSRCALYVPVYEVVYICVKAFISLVFIMFFYD